MIAYEKLFNLKYSKRLSTYELVCRYPKEIKRVSEVALLDVPEETLREVLPEKKSFERIMGLKRRYLKSNPPRGV